MTVPITDAMATATSRVMARFMEPRNASHTLPGVCCERFVGVAVAKMCIPLYPVKAGQVQLPQKQERVVIHHPSRYKRVYP